MNAEIPVFILTFSALALLVLVTFSVPFIHPLYFLHSSIAGGVKFGIWGWCLDEDNTCLPKQWGYSWDPQVPSILTKLHILFPISAALTFISTLALLPVVCSRHLRLHPYPLFSFLSMLSFLTSLAALAVALFTWIKALGRFHDAGFRASLGPSIWMSIAATVVLLLISVTSGCGMMCRGRFARRSSYIAYNY